MSASPESETVEPPACAPRASTLVSCIAGLYLMVQLVLPLLVMARPGLASRDFSWDMFSHGMSCSRLDVVAKTAAGATGSVRLDLDFASMAQVSRVLLPGRLSRYAANLCAKLRAETGGPVELHWTARCTDDRNAVPLALVDPKRDYCAAAP